jgi:competence protein ComEA
MPQTTRDRVLLWCRFVGWHRLVGAGIAVCVLGGVGLWLFLPSPTPVDPLIPRSVPSGAPVAAPTGAPVTVRVHVTGAVRKPGVYELSSTDRVIDAVRAAGGATEGADLEAINLAQTLLDTEQILVPRRKASTPARKPAPRLRPSPVMRPPATSATVATSPLPLPLPSSTSLPAAAETAAPPREKVNINTATLAQLDTLPGVGPTTARAILDYRRTKGPFRRIEDLMNVPGIGPTRFARVKTLITV